MPETETEHFILSMPTTWEVLNESCKAQADLIYIEIFPGR
jgi:hypothetical protein